MVRLDEYIFGYGRGRVDETDVTKLANVLLRLGICSSIAHDGEFVVRERDRDRFSKYARSKLRFELSEALGLYGFVVKNRRRYGVFLALALLSVIFLFTRGVVWDVRISGNESISDDRVIESLSEIGFTVGTRWRSIDKGKLETALLATHPEIAWVSLNRRGGVAYVEMIESENVDLREDIPPLYSNIVADRDGVIEEISVRSGEALVKVGDIVKAGDVLISGIIENEFGVRFCRAAGTVRAQSVTEITAHASRETTERVQIKRRVANVRVLLFNFSINIFKNYGNCENTCDIIEENRNFALFNKYTLPLKLTVSYAVEYSDVVTVRTDEEMIAAAKHELISRIRTEFMNSDVIKLRSFGELSGDVYTFGTRVVYATDIGKESAIEIN